LQFIFLNLNMLKKISGWGLNTKYQVNLFFPKNINQLKKKIKPNCIARGAGRSYGDSAIQPACTIGTKNLNKILKFDQSKGIIEVESGITIENLLNKIVKKGWFLPVTPGSKYITLGGMIASDVHGKNHHKVGSFRNFILNLGVLDENKKIIKCSKIKNKKLFNYSIGGMGLTGIIYSCTFKLKKIKSDLISIETIKNKDLNETISCINNSKNWDYNVAWIDTSASSKHIGRSILTRGNFSIEKKKMNYEIKKTIDFSIIYKILPNFFINKVLIKVLNEIYFFFTKEKKEIVSIDKFFYPLDTIKNWNQVYGNKGFVSYQCSFPLKNSKKIIRLILKILKSNRVYSFVSVLKSMGKNNKYLSFGQEGYTLVFDFPCCRKLINTLKLIDELILRYKGKIYLCKDSRISKKNFKNINKEFNNKVFRNLRYIKKNFFKSIQSERLGI
jgi:decaprenylphospho-beta-D-ribofuranose 2-oxidase